MKATHADFLVEPGDEATFIAFKRGESDVLRTTAGSLRRGLLHEVDNGRQFHWTSLWEDDADMLGFGRTPQFVEMRSTFMGKIRPFVAFSRHETKILGEFPQSSAPAPGDPALHIAYRVAAEQARSFLDAKRADLKSLSRDGLVTCQLHEDEATPGAYYALAVWRAGLASESAIAAAERLLASPEQPGLVEAPVAARCRVVFWDLE